MTMATRRAPTRTRTSPSRRSPSTARTAWPRSSAGQGVPVRAGRHRPRDRRVHHRLHGDGRRRQRVPRTRKSSTSRCWNASRTRSSLNPGWNLISVPGDPFNPAVGSVIGDLRADTVLGYQGGEWVTAVRNEDGRWQGTLTDIRGGYGYWVRTSVVEDHRDRHPARYCPPRCSRPCRSSPAGTWSASWTRSSGPWVRTRTSTRTSTSRA